MTVEIALIGAQRPFVVEALKKKFTVHDAFNTPDMLATLRELGPRIRGVASNGMAGLPAAVIEALPNLEVCSSFGVGLETVDRKLVAERGIKVGIAPVLYDDVADMGISLALAVTRKIVSGDAFVRSGAWLKGRPAPGHKMSGRRAGLIGCGRIGMAVGRRLEGFGMEIGYCDPYPKEGLSYTLYPDVVELARNSDYLFMCAAGTPDMKGYISSPVFEALGPGGFFINIARGWLVDEPALIKALQDGTIAGAGLDVFAEEPKVPAELIALENVVLMPHQASATVETGQAMAQCVIDNLVAHFEGKPLPWPAQL